MYETGLIQWRMDRPGGDGGSRSLATPERPGNH